MQILTKIYHIFWKNNNILLHMFIVNYDNLVLNND